MKVFFILIFLILPLLVFSQSDQKSLEEKVRNLEKERSRAIMEGDASVLRNIYSKEFLCITASGQILNRDELLDIMSTPDTTQVHKVKDEVVRAEKNSVLYTASISTTSKTGEVLSEARFSHVYMKRKGRWRIVYGQATPLK